MIDLFGSKCDFAWGNFMIGLKNLVNANLLLLSMILLISKVGAQSGNFGSWENDLAPITEIDWNYERAAHLLERAGFGGTPEQIMRLARKTPMEAVRSLVYFDRSIQELNSFDHSGIYDPGIDPFPPSRPATTELAKVNGEALGVKVKPTGNRRLQPVVNKFFYWLRAR